jgi:predicted adenylyl cyclase CyaB
MPINLELKVPCPSLRNAHRLARLLRARRTAVLHQTDTYYAIPFGRLKVREIVGSRPEVIYYQRPDQLHARRSEYHIARVRDVRSVKEVFKSLFGVTIKVRKERILYLYRGARIHLDKVKGLGTFIEFEVPVRRSRQEARATMTKLARALEIDTKNSIAGSYSDLLARSTAKSERGKRTRRVQRR